MDDYEYIDQWGDKWVCINRVADELCRSETYFMMEDPDNMFLPAAYCTRCKNPFDNLFQEHYVNGALDGKPIPPEKKISWMEYIRRDMVELNQQIAREREEYAKVKSSWKEGQAKELMLSTIKDYGTFLQECLSERKNQLGRILTHGK